MNLFEFVEFICTETGMVGDSDRAAARLFLSKRYELIYNSYLWKDSLVMVNVDVDPADADNAEGIVLMPEIIDRVVAIRTDECSVRVHGLEDYYRMDYNQFMRSGQPYEFSLLSPVWFVWRGTAGLQLTSAAPADDAKVVRVISWDTAGARRASNVAINSASPPVITDAAITSVLTVTGAGSTAYNGTYTYAGNAPTSFWPLMGANSPHFIKDSDPNKALYLEGSLTRWRIADKSTLASVYRTPDTNFLTGWVTFGTGVAPAPTVSYTTVQKIAIEAVFTPALSGILSLSPVLPGDEAGDTIPIGNTRSPACQRVRLFGIPAIATTLRVLGKKKFSPLTFDQEEPEIKNLDNCLIAFAMGNMWRRRRQFTKAADCRAEGVALLGELAKLETIQAAHNSRFIPDGGAGDAFFGPSRCFGLWY